MAHTSQPDQGVRTMGSFSIPTIWDWLALIIISLPNLFFIPAVKKAGFSAWWVALSLVPIVGYVMGNVMLWVFAYAKWPSYPDR